MNLLYYLKGIFGSVWSIFHTITLIDIIDIALISFIIYKLIKIIRETRAGQLAKGIVFILIIYITCSVLEVKTMEFILSVILNNGFIAILIMFQPEMRRALEKVGRTSVTKFTFFGDHSSEYVSKWTTAIKEMCEACEELSATKTGALIVIERKTKLGTEIDNGTIINAIPSKELFVNLFYPKSPLHDGAVIIRDGMVYAAGCMLPKPEREELINKRLGSRHRAAIGMSENSDAIVIAVSEETGTISVAYNGELMRNFTSESLNVILMEKIIPDNPEETQKKSRLFSWRDNR